MKTREASWFSYYYEIVLGGIINHIDNVVPSFKKKEAFPFGEQWIYMTASLDLEQVS